MTDPPAVIPQRYDPCIPLGDLREHPANPNQGDEGAVCESLDAHGFYGAVLVQESTGIVFAGNTRLRSARDKGMAGIPGFWCQVDDDTRDRILSVDNEATRKGRNDESKLVALLTGLAQQPRGLEGTGFDGDDLDALIAAMAFEGGGGGGGPAPEARPSLADRFLIPPFSVLDARQGWWQERKRAWIGLGIRSEIGRGEEVKGQRAANHDPELHGERYAKGSRAYTSSEWVRSKGIKGNAAHQSGISIFDPVLCEVAYRWFSPPHGHVIDPFAGGSVRGVLAAALGRTYVGNDLSAAQTAANAEQADELAAGGVLDRASVTWTSGDSADWVAELEPESADLIFTCPPYLWLERYSDDPADLSTMTQDGFTDAFTRILRGAADALRPDRFAVVVIGDARDKRTGRLADLHGLTVECAAKARLALHTTAILVTACGSLPIRAAKQFEVSRILGATHQDVLVFVKGDRKRAAKACGDVDLYLPDEISGAFSEEGTEDA